MSLCYVMWCIVWRPKREWNIENEIGLGGSHITSYHIISYHISSYYRTRRELREKEARSEFVFVMLGEWGEVNMRIRKRVGVGCLPAVQMTGWLIHTHDYFPFTPPLPDTGLFVIQLITQPLKTGEKKKKSCSSTLNSIFCLDYFLGSDSVSLWSDNDHPNSI